MIYADEFLKPLLGYVQYDVAYLAITTTYSTEDIAFDLELTSNLVQKRINMACERLEVEGTSRSSLRQRYIYFLENKLKELSK